MREAGAGWAALVLDLPEGLQDELSGSLGPESLGTQTTPAGADRTCLRIYVHTLDQARALLARALDSLAAWGVAPEDFDARVEAVEDGRWAEIYQDGLRPFPIGERFLVVPGGRAQDAAESPGRTVLLLVPGRAFGTGDHPTTRMCVAALERHVAAGSRWLDLGCGTGILAMAAVHLRAAVVHARDDDPEAIEVATEVLEANGAADRVDLALGSSGDLAGRGLDGVVANIAAPYFHARAPEAAAVLRPSGILVAAGFLASESEEIARSLARAGLSAIEEDHQDEWGLLVARREARA